MENDREAVEQLAIALMILMRNACCADHWRLSRARKCSMRWRRPTVALKIASVSMVRAARLEQFFYTALRNQLAAGLE